MADVFNHSLCYAYCPELDAYFLTNAYAAVYASMRGLPLFVPASGLEALVAACAAADVDFQSDDFVWSSGTSQSFHHAVKLALAAK